MVDSVEIYRPQGRREERHLNPISITEFINVLTTINGISWVIDPAGDTVVTNSDGSKRILEADYGFLIKEISMFCSSYLHDNAIVVHIKGNDIARAVCERVSDKLGASVEDFGHGYVAEKDK